MPLRKINISDNSSTLEIIRLIESKDRRFRLFQTFFMVGTFILLILVVSGQARTLGSIQEQVKADTHSAELADKQSKEQLQAITRRLDCVVVFFSTTDRTDLTVENVKNCSLNRDEDLDQFFKHEPGTADTTPALGPNDDKS